MARRHTVQARCYSVLAGSHYVGAALKVTYHEGEDERAAADTHRQTHTFCMLSGKIRWLWLHMCTCEWIYALCADVHDRLLPQKMLP